MKKLTILLFGFALVGACTPTSPTPPASSSSPPIAPPVLDGGTACSSACANLVWLGCTEGGPSCVDTCTHAAGLTDLKPSCLAAAKSKADARACGSVACP